MSVVERVRDVKDHRMTDGAGLGSEVNGINVKRFPSVLRELPYRCTFTTVIGSGPWVKTSADTAGFNGFNGESTKCRLLWDERRSRGCGKEDVKITRSV